MSEPLTLWTIYFDPSDYPGLYVVRAYRVDPDGPSASPDCATAPTLEAARELLPATQCGTPLYNLRREPTDDPCIVETWA